MDFWFNLELTCYRKATKIINMVNTDLFGGILTSRTKIMPIQSVKVVMPQYFIEAAILAKFQFHHNATVMM